MSKVKSFFSNVKKEWRKITWLRPEDAFRRASLVAVCSVVFGAAIAAMDYASQALVNFLLG